MNISWNVEELKNLLKNKQHQLKLCNNSRIHNELAFDINCLGIMVNQVDHVDVNYNDFTEGVLYKLGRKVEQNKCDISGNSKYRNALESTITSISPTRSLHTKIDPLKGMELVSYSLSNYNKEVCQKFKQLANNSYINLGSSSNDIKEYETACGICSSVLSEDMQLIYLKYENDLNSVINLAHEVGHADQFSKNHDVDGSINILASYFSEAYAIFHQLILIDNLECRLPKKELLNSKYKLVINYHGWAYGSRFNGTELYAYSNLLAFYFYYLYKTCKGRFEEIINTFNEMIYTNNDEEILTELDIKPKDLIDGYNYYISEYNQQKVMKRIF